MRKIIEEFEAAVRDHEMRGAAPLEERDYIELNYETTKKKLEIALEKAYSKKKEE